MNDKAHLYALMDARASDDIDDAIVLLIGTPKECCAVANKGIYGDGCVVVNLDKNEVMWEWFATNKWIPTNY